MDTIVGILAESSIRAGLIAGAVACVLRAMRMKSPAVRHRAWTGVLLTMLVLPFLSLWNPGIMIPLLPPYPQLIEGPRTADTFTKPDPPSELDEVAPEAQSTDSNLPGPAQAPPLAVVGRQSGFPYAAHQAAGILYLIGFSLFMVRLIVGMMLSRRLGRTVLPDERGFCFAPCNVPLTLGLMRPLILLPLGSRHWDDDRLASVLIHEREHVRRRDPLVEWLALLNRSIYWFHPLSWWLRSRLSSLAEQVCDEAVIAGGRDRASYAELLIELAHSVKHGGILAADWGSSIPSIQGGSLMGRIQRIVTAVPTEAVSRRRLILVALLCAAVIFVPAFGKLAPMQEYPSQNAVYLLSKGIDAEENSLNLDQAIEFYRQVLLTPADDRVYAAFAQFRLAQIFLLKGNLAAATREFEKLARNYQEYNELVSAYLAEDQLGVFHSFPSPEVSGQPIGAIRRDRYRHNLSGLEFSLQDWAVAMEGSSSGRGQIVTLQNPAKTRQISVWVKPDRLPWADIPARLRGGVQQKVLQRLGFQDYRMRRDSIQSKTINGKQALSAIADYVAGPDNTAMTEYFTWIYTEETRVQFFARVRASDFQGFKPLFDSLVSTAEVP